MKRRWHIITIFICFLTIFTSCNVDASPNLDHWIGDYIWSDSIPSVVEGNTPLFEQVVISIYKENDKYYASYERNGHQMGALAKAEVFGDENTITLVFMELAPDRQQPPYEDGDELVSLTKNGDGLITTWITDTPWLVTKENEDGVYFKKNDNLPDSMKAPRIDS